MLDLRHLRRALGMGGGLAARIAARWRVQRTTLAGRRRYGRDPRYNVQYAAEGFARRQRPPGPQDRAILERICRAYNCAAEASGPRRECEPTAWWQKVREESLAPVRQALARHDTETLQAMYGNFYRDPCSNGLIGLNLNIPKAELAAPNRKINQDYLLIDALSRVDSWREQTSRRFEIADLAGPDVGNPFGVVMEDTLVRPAAERHHYHAWRMRELTPRAGSTVFEIGGGFGGTAYYLLRDRPDLRYIDCDVPESLALAAYYLIQSFPEKKFLLYGEEDLNEKSLPDFDAILIPPAAIENLPAQCADVSFSAHTLADLTAAAQGSYLRSIQRITRSHFLYIGLLPTQRTIERKLREIGGGFELAGRRAPAGERHGFGGPREVELLYRVRSHADKSR